MNKNYFAPGAVYNDNHKEFTFNTSASNAAEILKTALAEEVSPVEENALPLFKYIHPSITSEKEQKQISGEVQNLVQNFPLPEVCRYLRQMYKDKRVYLNVKIEAMFDELHRLGLPSEETPGYSFKNFKNYFNINE